MEGKERREQILLMLQTADQPVSGSRLAECFDVSRQVIVQDIALLKAACHEIIATSRGYLCRAPVKNCHVFHVCHDEQQIEAELNAIVDYGGTALDVFVEHATYGTLRADLSIRSRSQVQLLLEDLKRGTSAPLLKVTQGEHYHTVTADSIESLMQIEEQLKKLGFLL